MTYMSYSSSLEPFLTKVGFMIIQKCCIHLYIIEMGDMVWATVLLKKPIIENSKLSNDSIYFYRMYITT